MYKEMSYVTYQKKKKKEMSYVERRYQQYFQEHTITSVK